MHIENFAQHPNMPRMHLHGRHPNVARAELPSTSSMAAGVLDFSSSKVSRGEVFEGGTDDINLGALLDTVPTDLKGDEGVAQDSSGVAALKAREAQQISTKLTPLEAQEAKKAAFAAKSAADAERGFLSKLPFP